LSNKTKCVNLCVGLGKKQGGEKGGVSKKKTGERDYGTIIQNIGAITS